MSCAVLLVASGEWFLIFALLKVLRDKKNDPKKCRDELVGPLRKIIGEPLPDNVEDIDPKVAEYARSQRAAANAAAAFCKECGKCRLGRAA